MSRIIDAILNNPDDPIITKNDSVKYYYNNGKPFLYDLVKYYEYGYVEWVERGGDVIDFIEESEKQIYKHPYIRNKAPWTTSMSNTHKIYMLKKNWFFYKRKFMELRHYKFKDDRLFIKHKPRKIKTKNIKRKCYVDQETQENHT